MDEPIVRFVPIMNSEQRDQYREIRHHQLEVTPYPDRPLLQPTQEEIERAHEEMTAPFSPPRQNLPVEPSPPTEPARPKRKSHPQLTDEQRRLVEGFIANHEGKPTPEWLAKSANIDMKYAAYLLRRYREKGTLAVNKSNRGRKSKAGEEHLKYMRDCMTENCRLKDREISQMMKDKFNMETMLHPTTILNYRHNIMPKMGLEKWTVKLLTKRDPYSNTEENKDRRIQVMKELNKWRKVNRVFVYIDETHFDFHRNWGRGKAPAGEKALCEGKLNLVSMSAITAISNDGPKLCHVHVKETITADKFLEFFEELLILYGDQECCFFLDNAGVHRKEDILQAAYRRNQVVLFNAPYSSEMNPIEFFFSAWKGRIKSKITAVRSTDEIKSLVCESFRSITAGICQKIISHVLTDVQEKVLNRMDL